MIPFAATAEQTGFPGVQQAARLTRFADRGAKNPAIETEWLITSRAAHQLPAQAMYRADRQYWGIENGLHLRLDVTAGEDRSRVRTPRAALNLGMIRRAVISVAVRWIGHCTDPRQATLQGFFDFMGARNARKAFSLVSVSKSSWLPK